MAGLYEKYHIRPIDWIDEALAMEAIITIESYELFQMCRDDIALEAAGNPSGSGDPDATIDRLRDGMNKLKHAKSDRDRSEANNEVNSALSDLRRGEAQSQDEQSKAKWKKAAKIALGIAGATAAAVGLVVLGRHLMSNRDNATAGTAVNAVNQVRQKVTTNQKAQGAAAQPQQQADSGKRQNQGVNSQGQHQSSSTQQSANNNPKMNAFTDHSPQRSDLDLSSLKSDDQIQRKLDEITAKKKQLRKELMNVPENDPKHYEYSELDKQIKDLRQMLAGKPSDFDHSITG